MTCWVLSVGMGCVNWEIRCWAGEPSGPAQQELAPQEGSTQEQTDMAAKHLALLTVSSEQNKETHLKISTAKTVSLQSDSTPVF